MALLLSVRGWGQAERPDFWWRCADGDSLLNFHAARTVGSGAEELVFDSPPYAREFTMVVVYRALDSAEAPVWRLEYADSTLAATRGLTTERIIADSVAVRYAGRTSPDPIINTLRQPAPDSTGPHVRLVLGGDTLPGRVRVAEVMYFGRWLDNAALRRVQCALAIRHGITLGPVDYVDGGGTPVWEYADSGLHHHRVTGIGRDSAYGLCQLRSRSEMAGGMLTVGADSVAEGAFLVVGDNDSPLAFDDEGDGVETLARQWKARATGMDGNRFTFEFDTRHLPQPTDSLVLLVDGRAVLPTVTGAGSVRFDGVRLPSDTCHLALGRGTPLWRMAQPGGKGGKGAKGDGGKDAEGADEGVAEALAPSDGPHLAFDARVFPNPTTGRYTLRVAQTGEEVIGIHVRDASGRTVERHSSSGPLPQYTYHGHLGADGIYYVTVGGMGSQQTIKIIVSH